MKTFMSIMSSLGNLLLFTLYLVVILLDKIEPFTARFFVCWTAFFSSVDASTLYYKIDRSPSRLVDLIIMLGMFILWWRRMLKVDKKQEVSEK